MPRTQTTPQVDTHAIAEAAFYIWLNEGQPDGRDADHWMQAEAALTAPVAKTGKAPAKAKSSTAKAKTEKAASSKTAASKTAKKPAAKKAPARKAGAAKASPASA